MRHFYLILASLLTFTGAMKAQTQFYKLVTDLTTEINDETLLIYDFTPASDNRAGIVHFTGANALVQITQSGVDNRFKPTLSYPVVDDPVNAANANGTKLTTEANAQFLGIKNDDGTYSFKNVGVEGYYMPASGNNCSTTAGKFQITENSTSKGSWTIYSASAGQYWNANPGSLSYWNGPHPFAFYRLTEGYNATIKYEDVAGTEISSQTTALYETGETPETIDITGYIFKEWKDSNSQVESENEILTAVYESTETKTITIEYQINGVKNNQVEYSINKGKQFSFTPNSYVWSTIENTYTNGTAINNDTTIVVNYVTSLPFKISSFESGAESFPENTKWYKLRIRSKEFKYDSSLSKYGTTANVASHTSDEYLVCFTGNIIDGFKIFNKAAGTSKILSSTSISSGANLSFAEYVDGCNYLWTAEQNGTNLLFKIKDTASGYMHDYSNSLSFWNTASAKTDGGSYITLEAQFVDLDDLIKGIEDQNYYSNTIGYVGGYTQEGIEAIKAAITTYNLETINNALNDTITFDPNKYYRLVSAWKFNGEPRVAYATDNEMRFQVIDKTSIKQIWKLTETGEVTDPDNGTYMRHTIKSISNGLYANFSGWNKNVSLSNAEGDLANVAIIPAPNNGKAAYNLQTYKTSINDRSTLYLADGEATNPGSDATEGRITTYNALNDAARSNAWYLMEVPTEELAISIGSTGFTTYYGNGNMVIPNDVTVYYGNVDESQEVIHMEEITTVVPTETGIIIEGTPNSTAKFDVLTGITNVEAISDNSLTGSTTATVAGDNYFALANKNSVVGFYKIQNGLSIPANKAYFIIPGASSNSFVFDFNNEGVTAIKTIENTKPNNDKIFDLHGRIVNNATKGIYIQNGKKFIVK